MRLEKEMEGIARLVLIPLNEISVCVFRCCCCYLRFKSIQSLRGAFNRENYYIHNYYIHYYIQF